MRRLLITLTVAGALAAPAVATAVTIQTSDTSQPWQAWVNQAQVPTWNGTIPFTAANDWFNCGAIQAEGCTQMNTVTDSQTGAITVGSVAVQVYNGPDAWYAKATLYHELGQVFDMAYMTPGDEAAFMQIVGLGSDASQWGNWLYGTRVVNGVTWHFPPFEWFAEGYRYCAQYGVNQPLGVSDEEGLFYPGDQAAFAPQQRQVCQLIDQVGIDNGVATPAQATYPPPVLKAKPTVKPKPRPRQKTRVKVIRPRRLHGSGFSWGTKRLRLTVR